MSALLNLHFQKATYHPRNNLLHLPILYPGTKPTSLGVSLFESRDKKGVSIYTFSFSEAVHRLISTEQPTEPLPWIC